MRLYRSKLLFCAAVIARFEQREAGRPMGLVLDNGNIVDYEPEKASDSYIPVVGDYYATFEEGESAVFSKAEWEENTEPVDGNAEIERLSAFVLSQFPHEIGRGNPREGESAVDVAMRLLAARCPPGYVVLPDDVREFALSPHVEAALIPSVNPDLMCAYYALRKIVAEQGDLPRHNAADEPELPLYEKDRECTGKCGECNCGTENGSNDYMVPSAEDARSCGTCAFGELVKGVNAECDACERDAHRPHWKPKPDEAEESLRP